jgi:uncharacterized protein GlcG (DUF336 family)
MTSLLPTDQKSVSAAGAQAVLAAALAKAAELRLPATVSVVDAHGNLKAFVREDGAVLLGIEFSRRKAYTSLAFGGANTGQTFDFISGIPSLNAAIPAQPGLALVGGAVALVQGGVVVGAIGVSAGSTDQDEEIATAGSQALA